MRRLVGIILIVQAVLTYLILNALNRLSVFLGYSDNRVELCSYDLFINCENH